MYFLYASPLMMLFLTEVDCSTNAAKFKKEPSMADNVCPAEKMLFEQEAVSPIFCLAIASLTPDALGVSYNEEEKMCYGCDTACDLGDFQPKSGTVFYSRPKACPAGFKDISEYMLMVVNDQNRTYDQAHCLCAECSAALGKMDSKVKLNTIRNHLQGLPIQPRYWIGSRKDTSDGLWKFVDGAVMSQNWYQGWPNTKEGYNCGYMHATVNHLMNRECDFQTGYICELN